MPTRLSTGYTKTDKAGARVAMEGAAISERFWLPIHRLKPAGNPALRAIALVLAAPLIPAPAFALWKRVPSELTTVNGWLAGLTISPATIPHVISVNAWPNPGGSPYSLANHSAA